MKRFPVNFNFFKFLTRTNFDFLTEAQVTEIKNYYIAINKILNSFKRNKNKHCFYNLRKMIRLIYVCVKQNSLRKRHKPNARKCQPNDKDIISSILKSASFTTKWKNTRFNKFAFKRRFFSGLKCKKSVRDIAKRFISKTKKSQRKPHKNLY